MFDEPFGASGGKRMIDGGFVKRKMFKGSLMIDGASIHLFNKLHDGITKIIIASENGRFDGRSATVEWELRRMDIQNAFWLKKVE